jgi:RimJ/RimL family protein N-acetyltransferase
MRFEQGKNIYIRKITKNDCSSEWVSWVNDRDITKFLVNQFWPITLRDQKKFVESSQEFGQRALFAICVKKNDKFIGIVSLSGINWVHGFADVAFFIGNKKFLKRNIGLEVFTLILRVAFLRFNLKNIKSVSANPLMKEIHRILGFTTVGVIKKLYFINQKFYDHTIYNLTKKHWLNFKH